MDLAQVCKIVLFFFVLYFRCLFLLFAFFGFDWLIFFLYYVGIHRTIGYDAFSKENRDYVEEHRWPPVSYLNELAEYERKIKGTGLLSSNLFSIFAK